MPRFGAAARGDPANPLGLVSVRHRTVRLRLVAYGLEMTNYPTSWRAAMTLVRNETWLVRVATHLLVLLPQLSAVEAARAAIDLHEEKQGLEPQVAAALFADDLTDGYKRLASVTAAMDCPRGRSLNVA
jgi:hypothetical protein